MGAARIFKFADFVHRSEGEPIRSVVTQSPEVVVVAWQVEQGQRIAAHTHPHGQDTWTVLSGAGEYQTDASGSSCPIVAGEVVVAHVGEVHGVFNPYPEPLVFVSVVAPSDAGYELQ